VGGPLKGRKAVFFEIHEDFRRNGLRISSVARSFPRGARDLSVARAPTTVPMDDGLAIAAASPGALPAFSATGTERVGVTCVDRLDLFLGVFNALAFKRDGGDEKDCGFSEIRLLTGIISSCRPKRFPH
jgi:hypothetical protein